MFFLYYCIMQGGRKLSSWNLLVKKVYKEGKAKNPNYKPKQAFIDASKRKSEMISSNKNTCAIKMKKNTIKGMGMSMTGGKSRRRSMAMAGGKSRRRSMSMTGGKSRRRK